MRSRRAVLLVLAVLTASFVAALHPAAFAGELTVAQEQDSEGSDSETGTDTDTDEGSGRTDAETGANEDQVVEGESEAEEGPPWTYQMARMILVLLVLMAVGIGGLYWRLVVQRQRHGV